MALRHTNPTRPRIDRQGRKQEAFAPYNFVPLPEKMVPARTPIPDQDSYREGCLTGWIECELETCSPVYVRGMLTEKQYGSFGQKPPDKLTSDEKNQMAPFFAVGGEQVEGLPRPVIPGSTLRGLVRELVEIAGYGRMRWVHDSPTFTFRAVAAPSKDPLRDPYRTAMGAQGSRPGYLEREGDQWFVRPAQTPQGQKPEWPADKPYLTLNEGQVGGKDIPGFRRLNSRDYEPAWFNVSFDQEPRRSRRGPLYTAVTRIGGRDAPYPHHGVLVCSGNMLETQSGSEDESRSRRTSPRRKHALILPEDREARRLPIPDQVVRDYVSGLTPFQKEHLGFWGGPTWGCLREGCPVFYTSEGGQVQWFGHCPNFRAPARVTGVDHVMTPRDYLPKPLRDDPRPDLADAIFGWVAEREGGPEESRAGRVFFSDARFLEAEQGAWLGDRPITPHTLSGPKPTTFQHYLVQDRSAGQRGHDSDNKALLAHYGSGPGETEIRGHKLYWHKGVDIALEASDKERKKEKQLSRMLPVKAGVHFRFRIDFENLRREELGALCWALTLPGESGQEYRHKLGMGKPLGMGAVTITPGLHLSDRPGRYAALFDGRHWAQPHEAAEMQPYVSAFEQYVLNALGSVRAKTSLAQLDRIRALLALLSWPGPAPELTRYLEIEHGPDGDEYNEYKERPVLPDPLGVLGSAVPAASAERRDRPAPPRRDNQADYRTGTVRRFGLGAGRDYGFIRPDAGGPDVFVHRNHLAGGIRSLAEGQSVRFRVVQGLKGLQADDVQVTE